MSQVEKERTCIASGCNRSTKQNSNYCAMHLRIIQVKSGKLSAGGKEKS